MTTAQRFVRALSAFFLVGALASGFSAITLLFPGTALDALWRVNPTGHAGLLRAGALGVVLMAGVCIACSSAARGLWLRRPWAHPLACAIITVNLLADAVNGIVRGDYRTLIGIPIAGAMLFYLLSPSVRAVFRTPPEAS